MKEIIKGILIIMGCLLILTGVAGYYEKDRIDRGTRIYQKR
ncbi:MAG: hypothetical protein ACLRY5_01320 [Zhenhengia sp.]